MVHTQRLLGTLLKQNHITNQFIVRMLRLLFCMLKSHTDNVEVCTMNALHYANSPVESKLSFLRSEYVHPCCLGTNYFITYLWSDALSDVEMYSE